MSDALDRLREAKLRITQPRKILMEVLEQAERPISAEEIMGRVGEGRLDLVTIYRNMTTFAENGLLQVIQLEGGKQLFELSEEGDHHHHIICRQCLSVIRLDLCFGGELEKLARAHGFTELSHTIEVFGLCTQCQSS